VSNVLPPFIGAVFVVVAVAVGTVATPTRRGRAGELCEPAPPRISAPIAEDIRGGTGVSLASVDSYAPPGLSELVAANPTAGAVGYGLSPLRGWVQCAAAAVIAQVAPRAGGGGVAETSQISDLKSQVPGANAPDVRFGVVDVFIDSGAAPLAAYQFELNVTAGDVTLVGVEGGDHRAYRQPPYYDPAALARQRIVIAAFDLGTDLPRGKTRVARLMVRVRGPVVPAYAATLAVAAGADGKSVNATLSVSDTSDSSTKPVSEGAGR